MQFRLRDQNGVCKCLTLDAIIRQLIAVHIKLVKKTECYLKLFIPIIHLPSRFPPNTSTHYCLIHAPSTTPSSIILSPTCISVSISVATCLTGLRVRIPLASWSSVSSECAGGLITRPEKSYWVYVFVCVFGWSRDINNEEALVHWGCGAIKYVLVFDWRLRILKLSIMYLFLSPRDFLFLRSTCFFDLFFFNSLRQGCTNYPKIWVTSNSRHQNRDMK